MIAGRTIPGRSLAFLGALLAVLCTPAASEPVAAQRAVRLVDRPLVDAEGRRHLFVADLLATRPAVLSFTFIACSSLCPPSDLVMDGLAAELAADGRDVRLITITLDPLTDTPDQLALKRKQHAAGRLFLTGAPRDVWAVLDGLGVQATTDQDHDVAFLVVSASGRRVHPVPGLVSPQALADAVRRALDP